MPLPVTLAQFHADHCAAPDPADCAVCRSPDGADWRVRHARRFEFPCPRGEPMTGPPRAHPFGLPDAEEVARRLDICAPCEKRDHRGQCLASSRCGNRSCSSIAAGLASGCEQGKFGGADKPA